MAKDFIQIDSWGAEEALEEMQNALEHVKGGALKSMRRALTKTAQGVRTDSIRKVREEFKIAASELRKKTSVKKSLSGDHPNVEVKFSDRKSVPLSKYDIRPRIPASVGGRLPKKGVSVQVKKTSGRKVIDGSFVAEMKSGHIGVFERVRGDSLPIRELYSASSIHELLHEDNKQDIRDQAEERLLKNAIREADYVLQKAGLR